MKQVNETLAQRGKHYGHFVKTFDVIQQIKDALKDGIGWAAMPAERREALEMIAVKLGRLVSGDSGHADSWHDIAGYARLVGLSLATRNRVDPILCSRFTRSSPNQFDRVFFVHPALRQIKGFLNFARNCRPDAFCRVLANVVADQGVGLP